MESSLQERCFWSFAKPILQLLTKGVYPALNQLGHTFAKMNAKEQCKMLFSIMKENLSLKPFLMQSKLNALTIKILKHFIKQLKMKV